jgi:hypothetical protein
MSPATEIQSHSGVSPHAFKETTDIAFDDNDLPYTIDDVLLKRLQSIPDEPLVGYPKSPSAMNNYRYYTSRELDFFTNGATVALSAAGIRRVRTMILLFHPSLLIN